MSPLSAIRNQKSAIAFALALALMALLVLAFYYLTRPPAPVPPPLRLEDTGDTAGFARALGQVDFRFPRDHGPHPDFQTEWWYYTGNLAAADGRRFGYQLTFFRRALAPGGPERPSDFATNQIYFAHLALTDAAGDRHASFERFSRGAAGLAGATGQPFTVWIENWRAESLSPSGDAVRLTAAQDGLALDLSLRAAKPIVAHGDAGLSPKSAAPGNASYYLSFTRMATTGAVTLPGQDPIQVTGESWFDHEWSTSALGAGAIGWDWFSLQLSDGQELMYFQIRREDGTLEPASSGTLVAAGGGTRRLAAADVRLTVLDTWRSPASRALYPAAWRLEIPSVGLDLTLRPLVADQEMDVSFVYWEGAVRLEGASRGQPLTGYGYVELTGYAASIAGQF
jgi:predicted secreted hydrolase